ncbi:MAG: hypothetical protein NTV21_12850 [Planctomycetota bacterium]|nr:hypothetical protein [Planctomycetota bacterium]
MNHRRFRVAALCGLFLASCRSVSAEDERREVLATFQGFFDWIETGEQERADKTVLPAAAFASVRNEQGEFALRHFTQAEFSTQRASDKRALRETIVGEPVVLIEGDIATVWCSYEFHVDGKLSHTGIDSFSLFRTPDGWRVAGGCYSVVKTRP